MREPLTAGGARPHTRRARPEPPPPGSRTGSGGSSSAAVAPGSKEAREGAREAALRLLSARDRSSRDLRSRLARKGFDAADIDHTLVALRRAGLQDDERFARAFAEEAVSRRGLSGAAVRGELRRRGIDASIAEHAAAAIVTDEEGAARALAEQKAARMSRLEPQDRIRRLVGLLARRGYEPQLCYRIAREVGGETSFSTPSV